MTPQFLSGHRIGEGLRKVPWAVCRALVIFSHLVGVRIVPEWKHPIDLRWGRENKPDSVQQVGATPTLPPWLRLSRFTCTDSSTYSAVTSMALPQGLMPPDSPSSFSASILLCPSNTFIFLPSFFLSFLPSVCPSVHPNFLPLWPHYIAQAGYELAASPSLVLPLQVCATTQGSSFK